MNKILILSILSQTLFAVRDGWIDPHSMEKPTDRSESRQLNSMNFDTQENVVEKCALPGACCTHLKQFISHLKTQLKSVNLERNLAQSKRYTSEFILTSEDAILLHSFIKNGGDVKSDLLIDVVNTLIKIFTKFHEAEDEFSDSPFDQSFDWMSIVRTAQAPVRLFIDLFAFVIVTKSVIKMSWSQLLLAIIMMALFAGFIWNWFRMYLIERAKLVARMRENDAFKACQPPSMNPLTLISNVFSSVFVLPKTKTACEQYYVDIMSEPWAQVSPFKAVAVTFTEAFATPLSLLLDALGDGINRFLRHFPLAYQPIAILLLIVIIILVLLFNSRYGISLLYGLVQITPHKQDLTALRSPYATDPQMASIEQRHSHERKQSEAQTSRNRSTSVEIRRRSTSLSRPTSNN